MDGLKSPNCVQLMGQNLYCFLFFYDRYFGECEGREGMFPAELVTPPSSAL